MSELETLGASLWDQAGRKPSTAKELANILSMDLRWFRPEEAREVVQALVAAGILDAKGESLSATGVIGEMEVPRGYRPSKGLLEEARRSQVVPLFDRILAGIPASAGGEDRAVLEREAQQISQEIGLSPEGAALLVAWRRGIRDLALVAEFESSLKGNPAK